MCELCRCACAALHCAVCNADKIGIMQALGHCLEAGSQAAAAGQEEEGIIGLVQRWMFPLVKKGLPAPNLAVRQVNLLPACTCSWL